MPDGSRCSIEQMLMHNYSNLNNYDECRKYYEIVKVNKGLDYKLERKWVNCLKTMKMYEEAMKELKEMQVNYQSDRNKSKDINDLIKEIEKLIDGKKQ